MGLSSEMSLFSIFVTIILYLLVILYISNFSDHSQNVKTTSYQRRHDIVDLHVKQKQFFWRRLRLVMGMSSEMSLFSTFVTIILYLLVILYFINFSDYSQNVKTRTYLRRESTRHELT